jgi:hypothetical protein
MIYRSYAIAIDKTNAFHEKFLSYCRVNNTGGARLLGYLRSFKDSQTQGEYLRGTGQVSIYVIPPREDVDHDGEAGMLVEINDAAKTIKPVLFIPPITPEDTPHDRGFYIRWAEQYLGI